MKPLLYYVENSNYDLFRLSYEEKQYLLELDREYNDICDMFRHDFETHDVQNLDEECEKFLAARAEGKKYFPQIRIPDPKFSTDGILPRAETLLRRFREFNCYLSKYYIELLEPMVKKIRWVIDPDKYAAWYIETCRSSLTPSHETYEAALKMLRENPYIETDDNDKTISAKEAVKEIQTHIDSLGYKWKVQLKSNMIPRMQVDANGHLNVKNTAKFSKTDIEGLKKHEVEGHVGRRYYGLCTGLYLFLYGLLLRNVLDEGLAIWNSLNKCEIPKPNIKFNIALKCIIAYWLPKKDFYEIFDLCKELVPNIPDKKLFSAIVRPKAELMDCSKLGGNGDQSYFEGYQIVKNMSKGQRSAILKYNIGPSHVSDIPNIRKFLEINKFKSLI